tara:strand:+ start:291 stop:1823 length:1533 start_codon:yes stop_codon:yes gene_type:complete
MLSCLEVTGLTKSFAGPVLRGVKLRIKAKTIHGLVGENGAGKSTFINIISGLLDPDDGSVKLNGRSFKPKSRRQSLGQGVALASQELSLIDNLSVAENIFLSALPTKKHRIDVAELQYNARELLDLVGLEESLLETPVANLSLAEKQLVELAKALSLSIERTSLLILDEPTAALNSFQAERLHKILLDRAKQGVSILYVSHRLEDVLSVCDEVSVLHDGEIKLTSAAGRLTSNRLIEVMTGRELQRQGEGEPRKYGKVRLRVEDLSSRDLPHPVSLVCRSGEILGIAGLSGSGRSELLHAMFGFGVERKGSVILCGTEKESEAQVEINSPSEAVKNGIGLIAEDRKSQGIFTNQALSMNVTVAGLGKLGRGLNALFPDREKQRTIQLVSALKIKCLGPSQTIDRLSGGNQQKALLARWLEAGASVWLLDEPTRGVDAESKLGIHRQLRELRNRGVALVIVSSEMEELTDVCDRILVMSNKKRVDTFSRDQWSKARLLEAAFSEYKTNELI